MIDIENVVLTSVATSLRNDFTGINVSGEYIEKPSEFPCVTICEDDNSVYQKTQSNTSGENHALLVYNINVYTNKQGEKHSQAKAIANAVDLLMQAMGFTRTTKQPVPNIDRSVYRITMRYTGVVDSGTAVGDNTVYKVYRR